MNDEINHTIVAVSTPPGEGGIGIVRMSGNNSFAVARKIFFPSAKRKNEAAEFEPLPRYLHHGFIRDKENRELDEVLVSFMPAPHTYTREDVVEINCHGGIVPLGKILKLILSMGVSLAEPGEFTRRAFLNGRIDLVQAESVLTVINSRTERGLHSSLQGLKGYLSREIGEMEKELLEMRAVIEVDGDFPLEDVEEVDYSGIKKQLDYLLEKTVSLRNRSKQGRILQEGLKTVIAGKPNVGKSSLYNLLLKEERAIVTDIPGTTRDILSEHINMGGIPINLMDTAGLRRDGDKVENIGMDYSRRAIKEADLIIFMLDLSDQIDREDIWIFENLPPSNGRELLIVGNKIDQKRNVSKAELKKKFPGEEVIEISAATGEGVDKLEKTIQEKVFSGGVGDEEGVLVMVARQAVLIDELVKTLGDAASAMEKHLPLDVVAIDLQHAYRLLQNLLGNEATADILDHIFNNFCIGK